MLLRQEALRILLGQFGAKSNEQGIPKYQSHIIYECADNWVSSGNLNCDGIIQHFLNHLLKNQIKIVLSLSLIHI